MVRPRQISDDEILQAACAVFLQHGPGASTVLIAERCGVSQAAIFKRFGTKEELMVEALRPPTEPPFIALLNQGPDERPLDVQLVEAGLAISATMDIIVPRMMCLKSSGFDIEQHFRALETPPPLLAHQALVAFLDRATRNGLLREDVDRNCLAAALLGAMHIRAFHHHMKIPNPAFRDTEHYVRRVIEQLWRGVAPVEAP